MDYPQTGVFTVTLKTLAGVFLTNPRNYNLQLQLVGISGPNIGVSNLLSLKMPTTN